MHHDAPNASLDAVLDELRPALRANIQGLAENLLGDRNKALSSRTEWRFGSKGALRITVSGPNTGACADFSSDWKGDPLGLIIRERGGSFHDAVLWGAAFAGIDTAEKPAPTDPSARARREVERERKRQAEARATEADRQRRIQRANRLWAGRQDPIDTPAETYAVITRGIPLRPVQWPDHIGFLPPNGECLRWQESGPDGEEVECSAPYAGALMLAATGPDGRVLGVQLVYVDADGRSVRQTEGAKIKRSFGAFQDTGAAVRLPGPADGPLLVAEGPETGLSLWAATGYETYIAVGNLVRIVPPTDRRVVICRDDDRPASPADKAFDRLVKAWMEAGVGFAVATPWTARRGDKSDFNDVIQAGGVEAVRARIAVALDPPKPTVERLPITEARAKLGEAVDGFFTAAREWLQQSDAADRQAVEDAKALVLERLPPDALTARDARLAARDAGGAAYRARQKARALPPGEARKAAEALARQMEAKAQEARQWSAEARERAVPLKLEVTRLRARAKSQASKAARAKLPPPPAHAVRIDVGAGKSHAARAALASMLRDMRAADDGRSLAVAVPTHRLGAEQSELFASLPNASNLIVKTWRGREAADPDNPGSTMCMDLPAVKEAEGVGLDVQRAVCSREVGGEKLRCPFFEQCGYQRQRREGADLWLMAHELLFAQKPAAVGDLGAVVIDESFWQAGLRGQSDLALDALAQPDDVPDDPIGGQRLRFLRGMLLDALRDAPDGPVSKATIEAIGIRKRVIADIYGQQVEVPEAIEGGGISFEAAGEALTLEWRRHVDGGMVPGMSAAERQEAARAAIGNRTVRKLAHLWQAIQALMRHDGPPASGWAALATVESENGPSRVIRLKGRRDLGAGWQGVPTLCLDATLDPTLLTPYLPELNLTADIRVAVPHQRIVQVRDRSYSKALLVPNQADDEAGQGNALRAVHAIIGREARRYCGRVLVVAQKAVEDALPGIGPLPVNTELAHHNAIAGRDEWGAGHDRDGIEALIVVGRTVPGPREVEDMAEALTGEAINRLPGWYPRVDCTREISDGISEAIQADRHPQPIAEAIRWQIAEGELVQIIGRARGVNRTEVDPVDILVMTSAPLPLPVERTISAADLVPTPQDLMLAAGGAVFSNPTDAAAAYPHLWETRKAAKSAMERVGKLGTKKPRLAPFPNNTVLITKRGQPNEFCPQLLKEVTYQVAGDGHRPVCAWHDPAIVLDIAAWLTERLGLLAWCGERPKLGPAPNVIEVMATRGLIVSNAGHAASLYPDLFSSKDAAKKAIGRVLGGRKITDLACTASLTIRVRYQAAGQGAAQAEALVAPDRLEALQSDLTAALGPLSLFQSIQETQ